MKFYLKFAYGISLIFLASLYKATAQEKDTTAAFTLESAINYALENSVEIRNSVIDEQIAKARVGELRATGLPQINGSVQLTHSDPLQRMFFTASEDNPIIGGSPGLDELPEGSVIALQNFFQLPSSGDAGITINQLIFNGSYFVGLKAAKTYKELASKTTEQTRIQIVENVTKAFYAVLINEERLKLFQENIARVDSLLRNTKGLYKNGFAENIDVARVQVTKNNLTIEKENFENLLALTVELLKFQMNYPMAQKITIVGDFEDLEIDSESILELSEDFEYGNRIEYSVLKTQEELQKLDIKNNLVNYLPSISAFANLGYFTQSPNIKGIFKTETNMPESHQIGPDKWYRYGMYGVTLNVPIFDGLTKSYKIQQSKLNLLKVENGFENLESGIDLEVNQSKINLTNTLKTLESQKETIELAEEVARVTKIKYTSGIGSNLEVTEAETALREAQTNYYNALYDVILAQIDLQTALGILIK